jgi:branched-subunit amino acid transport protein
MTLTKRLSIVIVTGMIVMTGLELGERLSIPGVSSVVSPAQAIIGRPLTPVSVAGVGRRTVRRCAAGVYYC